MRKLLTSASVPRRVSCSHSESSVDMASPKQFGRSSMDIHNVMQKLQGECHPFASIGSSSGLVSVLQHIISSVQL